MTSKEEAPEGVRLVVADVDGALVTPDKVITPRARNAVRKIIEAGIAFTITSGRPPRGMKMLIDTLQLQDPITAFNGALFLNPDLSMIRENLLPPRGCTSRDFENESGESGSSGGLGSLTDTLTKNKLDVWIYSDKDWYVPSRPHVDCEEWTVKFAPTTPNSKVRFSITVQTRSRSCLGGVEAKRLRRRRSIKRRIMNHKWSESCGVMESR